MLGRSPSRPDPSSPHWESIDDHLLREIYTADQAIYPAPLLAYERLRSWAAACPELSICLRQHDPEPAAQGVVIVLPLKDGYWGRLVAGELREHEVDPSDMFPPAASAGVSDGAHGYPEVAKVGLHVFHVERYSPSARDAGRAPPFTLGALEEVRSRVGERFPSWHIVGYSGPADTATTHLSALTATPQGNRAFKRLGFTSGYVETKADGDEAEMLVREGNDTFTSS